MGPLDKFFKKKYPLDFPPRPKWKPNLPINLDIILQKAKYYTNEKLQLGIFNHGTVVFFSERVDNIAAQSLATLDKIYNFHPDFDPIKMDDGNYLVEYSQPAFTIVFNEELTLNWDYIEQNHLEGLCASEVLINVNGESNKFDRTGKIALFGRAKMFQDAQDPRVARTFDPSI
jgi:hypothetical protein